MQFGQHLRLFLLHYGHTEMSIYYALVCQKCRRKIDFVTTAGGYSIMNDEGQPKLIAEWFGRHSEHKEEIAIFSEYDPQYTAAADD